MSSNYSNKIKLKFTPSRKETQGCLWGIHSKEPAKYGPSISCKENWAASWGAKKDYIDQWSTDNYYKSWRKTEMPAKDCFGFNYKEI